MVQDRDPLAADDAAGGPRAEVEDYPIAPTGVSVLVLGVAAELHGWCIRETTGAAAAVCRIRDGRDVSGSVMAPISVAANGTSAVMLGEDGIGAETGLYLEVASGSVEATIYARAIRSRRGG